MTLRVLHLVNRWETGGVQRHVCDLSDGLRAYGIESRVAGWCAASPAHADAIPRVPTLEVLPLPLYHPDGVSRSLSGQVRAIARVIDLVTRERITLLHVHSRLALPVAAAVARATGTARIATMHNIFEDLTWLPWLPEDVIVLSDVGRDLLRRTRHDIAQHRVHVITNGVTITTSAIEPAGTTTAEIRTQEGCAVGMPARTAGVEDMKGGGMRGEGLRNEDMRGEGLRVEGLRGKGLRVEGLRAKRLRGEGLRDEDMRVEDMRVEGTFSADVTSAERVPVLAFIGRFVELKGGAILIDAADRLARMGMLFRLAFAGDGVMAPQWHAAVEACRLGDRTTFHGMLADVRPVLASCDILVQPSLALEAAPYVPLDALAAGRPVVCSDLPVFRELYGACTAVRMFRTGDAADLARVLGAMLALSDGERAVLGRAGTHFIRAHHSKESMVRNTEAAYRRAVAGA